MLIEMAVDSVRVNVQSYQRVVILKEKKSGRYLPIFIGNSEADAIIAHLHKVKAPRPQTHDLIKSIFGELGARVSHIVVNDLSNDVYYARINVELEGRHHEIDARPSDAIAVAIRLQAPIYCEEAVLEKGAVELEPDEETDTVEASGAKPDAEAAKPTERIPTAFRDFIDTLDLDDLGRGGEPERGKR